MYFIIMLIFKLVVMYEIISTQKGSCTWNDCQLKMIKITACLGKKCECAHQNLMRKMYLKSKLKFQSRVYLCTCPRLTLKLFESNKGKLITIFM